MSGIVDYQLYNNLPNMPYLYGDGIQWFPPQIKCKLLDENAIPLKQDKPGDAGYDLYALEDTIIPSLLHTLFLFCRELFNNLLDFKMGEDSIRKFAVPDCLATKVRTGIAVQIPVGNVGLIWDRSSLGSQLIKVFGGVIDCNYRKEVMVCLANFSFFDYKVKKGDKIAQMVVQYYSSYPVVKVDELDDSNRDGGFGTTGK